MCAKRSVLWIIGSTKNGPRACAEGATRKQPVTGRAGIYSKAATRRCSWMGKGNGLEREMASRRLAILEANPHLQLKLNN